MSESALQLMKRQCHSMVSISQGKTRMKEGATIQTFKHYMFGGLSESPFKAVK
jgi:hypothetical protein